MMGIGRWRSYSGYLRAMSGNWPLGPIEWDYSSALPAKGWPVAIRSGSFAGDVGQLALEDN
jgi:hypothetical protein